MNTRDDLHGLRARYMEDALEEERSNRVTRAWSTLLLVIGGAYYFGLGILSLLISKVLYPMPLIETDSFATWVISVPTAIFLTLGGFGWLFSSENQVMKLRDYEIAQIEGKPGAWHNLPPFGRVLLAICWSIIALSIAALILRILYKVLT